MNMFELKLDDIIDAFISGDWGNEEVSEDNPNKVFCVRGADIVPILNNYFSNIPERYVSNKSFNKKLLSVGDIVIEKSGGSPTQSTGRAVLITDELIKAKGNVVCSNFCVAIRVKNNWNPQFVFQLWQNLYNSNVFFNFEGKTSGIKNLQLESALQSITVSEYPRVIQDKIVSTIKAFDRKIALNREINRNLPTPARSSTAATARRAA